MRIELVSIKNVLTRTTGYLTTVTSHSLQPYRGCSFGRSLCGIGCYVRHNRWVTRGREWGEFLEVRRNAASAYSDRVDRERLWAHHHRGDFSIFLSSSTEPFLPQEKRFGVTRSLLEAMVADPPDRLIIQTHSDRVVDHLDVFANLSERCDLRVHVSIETDIEDFPGLPPHASSVKSRLEACGRMRAAGLTVVACISPLLPIRAPDEFLRRIAENAEAAIIDHFIEGDGTPDGSRTWRTELPRAMAEIEPESVELAYRDRIVAVAREHLPGRVGVGPDGFAGRYLP